MHILVAILASIGVNAFTPNHVVAEDGSVVSANYYSAPDWQGGLSRGSEVWWTGECLLDTPAIHIGRTPLHGHFTRDHSLYVYPSNTGRVVWDGVNLTNNTHRSITFAAACIPHSHI